MLMHAVLCLPGYRTFYPGHGQLIEFGGMKVIGGERN
jgi:hypothetical protein